MVSLNCGKVAKALQHDGCGALKISVMGFISIGSWIDGAALLNVLETGPAGSSSADEAWRLDRSLHEAGLGGWMDR